MRDQAESTNDNKMIKIQNGSFILKEKLQEKQKPTIKDFELNEVVGIGNFGRVVKAFNTKTQT